MDEPALDIALTEGVTAAVQYLGVPREITADSAAELRDVLCLAPRLFGFSHRPLLSLRHRYVAFSSWAHLQDPGRFRTCLKAALDCTSGTAPQHLLREAERWHAIGELHAAVMEAAVEVGVRTHRESSRPWRDFLAGPALIDGSSGVALSDCVASAVEACRYRVEHDLELDRAVRAVWRLLVRSDVPDAVRQYRGTVTAAAAMGVMPPHTYVHFHLKVAALLTDPACLADLVDFIVGDLLIDVALFGRSQEGAEEDGERAVQEEGGDGITRKEVSRAPADMAGALGSTVYASGGSPEQRLRGLPPVPFSAFKASLLELCDNWTSTAHPHEWAAFVWRLHERCVAHPPTAAPTTAATAPAAASKRGPAASRANVNATGRHTTSGGPSSVGGADGDSAGGPATSSYGQWVQSWAPAEDTRASASDPEMDTADTDDWQRHGGGHSSHEPTSAVVAGSSSSSPLANTLPAGGPTPDPSMRGEGIRVGTSPTTQPSIAGKDKVAARSVVSDTEPHRPKDTKGANDDGRDPPRYQSPLQRSQQRSHGRWLRNVPMAQRATSPVRSPVLYSVLEQFLQQRRSPSPGPGGDISSLLRCVPVRLFDLAFRERETFGASEQHQPLFYFRSRSTPAAVGRRQE